MSSHRSDVSRLFQHLGISASDYLQFATAQAESRQPRRSGSGPARPSYPGRIADPVARAAYLRAKLLAEASR